MKRIFVKISWDKRQPLKTAAFARGTATAMNGNATFASPAIKTADISKAAERVEIAYANRRNGETGKDELQNASIDLDEKLHTQAEYVDDVAKGDETIIHLAGFETTTPTNASLARATIANATIAPVLTPVTGGTIKVKAESNAAANNYLFFLVVEGTLDVSITNSQISFVNGCSPIIISSTKHTCNFTGIAPKKTVQVAVAIANASGIGSLSAISSCNTI